MSRATSQALLRIVFAAAFSTVALRGQEAQGDEGARFEVASVHQTAPWEPGKGVPVTMRGGPGSKNPTSFTCRPCTMQMLLGRAYDIVGPGRIRIPASSAQLTLNIDARLPERTTKEQFQAMLRNLLRDRLRLVAHFETREEMGLGIEVSKGGHKLRPAPQVDPPGEGMLSPSPDADGFLVACNGCLTLNQEGLARMRFKNSTIEELARSLSSVLHGKTVVDASGLGGRFDFVLTWDPRLDFGDGEAQPATAGVPNASDPPGRRGLAEALRSQLGLRLSERKVAARILVVDHIDKTPAEN